MLFLLHLCLSRLQNHSRLTAISLISRVLKSAHFIKKHSLKRIQFCARLARSAAAGYSSTALIRLTPAEEDCSFCTLNTPSTPVRST